METGQGEFSHSSLDAAFSIWTSRRSIRRACALDYTEVVYKDHIYTLLYWTVRGSMC